MRFKLILDVCKGSFGNLLPINYQYALSAVVYRMLAKADEEYASWLHENGFTHEYGKQFKLFTFSRLKIEKRKILPTIERIAILCNEVEWQITFLPEKSTGKFIQGVFSNQVFEIGDKISTVQFRVRSIEAMQSPKYEDEMTFTTMSPICLRSKQEDEHIQYLSPADPLAEKAIFTGLSSRYEAYYQKAFASNTDFKFTLLNEPKSVLATIKAGTPKQTKVRGYMCQFKMKAPTELMKVMYEGGIGEENALGFGCLGLKK